MNIHKLPAALSIALLAVSMLSGCGEAPTPAPPAEDAPPEPTQKRIPPVALPANEAVPLPNGPGRSRPLPLKSGQAVAGKLVAPRAGTLVAMDMMLGNFRNSSDGMLKLELCKDESQQCVMGSGNLLSSVDNKMFSILLDKPLEMTASEALSYQLQKQGGSRDVVVWIQPAPDASGQAISRKGAKAIEGHAAKVVLRYAK